MESVVLDIQMLTKQYGTSYALKDVNFNILSDELLCVIGPSGSGKSTLLNIIAGTETPTSGEISYSGQPLSQLPPHKRDFGVVFQGLNLFPHLSVFDNIAFSLKTSRHRSDKAVIKGRVNELLTLFRLESLESRRPSQLSGGEKQRVAIARAIAFQPRVLLLDEPFSALDRLLKEALIIELKSLQLRLGLTIIYITHDQYEAANLSDRVVVLNHGEIQQIGSYEQLYSKPSNKFVRQFIGFNNIITGLISGETESTYTINIKNVYSFEVSKNKGFSVGQQVEAYIRPEDIFKISKPINATINTIQVKVIKSIKSEMMYKISVELLTGEIWHFYDLTEKLDPNDQINISFHVDRLFYYN